MVILKFDSIRSTKGPNRKSWGGYTHFKLNFFELYKSFNWTEKVFITIFVLEKKKIKKVNKVQQSLIQKFTYAYEVHDLIKFIMYIKKLSWTFRYLRDLAFLEMLVTMNFGLKDYCFMYMCGVPESPELWSIN